MEWTPLIAGAVLAALVSARLAPSMLRAMSAAGLVRESWRGVPLPCPAGLVVVAAALLAVAPLALADQLRVQGDGEPLVDPALAGWAPYVLGVALLGLIDDLLGRPGRAEAPRGWRGHGASLLRGRPSTGVLKAVGAIGLAALAVPREAFREVGRGAGESVGVALVERTVPEYLVAIALLVLLTNLLNLLDTKPGRAGKGLILIAGGISLATWTLHPAAQLAPFLGAVVVVWWLDLRGRTMLGDTGSNLLGAIAGIWAIVALTSAEQLVALLVVLGLTAYGEFRSLGATIERIPLVRRLDSLGRRDPVQSITTDNPSEAAAGTGPEVR